MNEYCAFMSVHVNSQLFIEQYHICFAIHGGGRAQNIPSSDVEITLCSHSHLARLVPHCGHCVFFIKPFPWWPSHMLNSHHILLY